MRRYGADHCKSEMFVQFDRGLVIRRHEQSQSVNALQPSPFDYRLDQRCDPKTTMRWRHPHRNELSTSFVFLIDKSRRDSARDIAVHRKIRTE